MLLSFTASNRFHLFRSTLHSMLQCVKDLHLVSGIVLIDDGSPPNEFKQMIDMLQSAFPGREIAAHTTDMPKGHACSMQKWYELISGEYIFHCEDDWLFIRRGNILSACIEILQSSPDIGQVVLSRNPNRTPATIILDGKCWTYDFDPTRPHGENVLQAWPYFMLNPGAIKLEAIRKTGNFHDVRGFEYDYALRWVQAGYKTVFSIPRFVRHIGDESAYTINGTER